MPSSDHLRRSWSRTNPQRHSPQLMHSHTQGLLLRMSQPADAADQFLEEGFLSLLQQCKIIRRIPPNFFESTSYGGKVDVLMERFEAHFTLTRCLVRFFIHFIKGLAVGTGVYVTDYLLVNGQFSMLLETISRFILDEFERWLDKGDDDDPDDEAIEDIEARLRFLNGRPQWDPSNTAEYDLNWLMTSLEGFSGDKDTLFECILATLQSSSPVEDKQNELLELLGLEAIELVSEIINNLTSILESYELDQIEQAAELSEEIKPGQTIKVRTTLEMTTLKRGEKYGKKKGIVLSSLSTSKHLQSSVTKNIDLSPSSGSQNVSFPGVYKSLTTGSALSSYMGKLALPEGTIRDDQFKYEEFNLPYQTAIGNNPRASAIHIVPIGELDEFSQRAFPGYRSLNRMQSAVCHVALETSENMLVCAPTGAGKTDVAMLTVLKCIHDYRKNDGSIAKDSFKIVYVAPMKALAAEVTSKFSKRLKPYGLSVREYTGDMQLSKSEVRSTQMLVTTPEKWDVLTRKSQGDTELVDRVRLLIIDEVHLLQDDRGSVLEAIVARTLRAVEMSQRPIRLVGLSATLPNYVDVACFLRVNLYSGLFYFDEAFRPVPLSQSIIGIKGNTESMQRERLNQVCFDRCCQFLSEGHQVMIFVHSRNETVSTARQLIRTAMEEGKLSLFLPPDVTDNGYKKAGIEVSQKSRNRELQDLFKSGLAMHHAGMLRSDRNLVESLFEAGHVRVLVCTATLAWGVNLPAHAVIIKGTSVWDSQRGGPVRLGVLDVLQIFGRAGRPQYESHGEAILLTKHADLHHYLTALLTQTPIESRLGGHLPDLLNAEIALGTVSNIEEAIRWLTYSYLSIRVSKNPTAYGLTPKDPTLHEHWTDVVRTAALSLKSSDMIGFDPVSGRFASKDLGRIASHYYLGYETVGLFASIMGSSGVTEEVILAMISQATEFKQLKVRPEELTELDNIEAVSSHLQLTGIDKTGSAGKAAILIQAWISKQPMESFSLVSDLNYIGQNTGRIMRAAWQIALSQAWPKSARACLNLALSFERQSWMTAHPVAQIILSERKPTLPLNVLETLQIYRIPIEDIRKKDAKALLKSIKLPFTTINEKGMEIVKKTSFMLPLVKLNDSRLYPISPGGFIYECSLDVDFIWDQRHHDGGAEIFHAWLETSDCESFLTRESKEEFCLEKDQKQARLKFFLTSAPKRFYLRVLSDRWLLPEFRFEVVCGQDLTLPKHSLSSKVEQAQSDAAITTDGLNPVLRQAASLLDNSLLVCGPVDFQLDKLIEMIIMNYGKSSSVLLCPNNALATKRKVQYAHNKNLAITGPQTLLPKDSIDVLIIEGLDLLDAAMELAIQRFLKARPTKLFAIGGPISNVEDLAKWLGISKFLAYGPESRLKPIQAQIQGFTDRSYAGRQASMEKPIYQAALNSTGTIIVWCPTKHQANLTAQSIVAMTSNDDAPKRFCAADYEADLDPGLPNGSVKDFAGFGIGLLFSNQKDHLIRLFRGGRIRILICPFEMAFDLPKITADLVIIKGTESHKGQCPTSLIQTMINHASNSLILMTQGNQKSFYRQVLCEAPLIESSMLSWLPEAIEICGTNDTTQVLQWIKQESLLGLRLPQNCQYYGCASGESVGQDEFLWKLIETKQVSSMSLPASWLCWEGRQFFASSLLGRSEDIPWTEQSLLRLVSVTASIELECQQARQPSLLRSTRVDPEDLKSLASSQAFSKAIKWFYGDAALKWTEDCSLLSTKLLLLLLAKLFKVPLRPGHHQGESAELLVIVRELARLHPDHLAFLIKKL